MKTRAEQMCIDNCKKALDVIIQNLKEAEDNLNIYEKFKDCISVYGKEIEAKELECLNELCKVQDRFYSNQPQINNIKIMKGR